MSKPFLCPILAAALLVQLGSAAHAWQTSHWAEGFEGRVFATPDTLAVHDSGTGPELLAFGRGTVEMAIRFEGASWSIQPPPPANVIGAAEFFSIGGAPALVCASGTPAVLQLANGNWSTIGTALQAPPLAVTSAAIAWDDGSGPAVYVAGTFQSMSGVPAGNIARWNGTTWSALGLGLDGPVGSLTVYDDGSGPALYAGGSFNNAGGNPAPGVARWRGGTWSSLPGVAAGSYKALQAFDDGTGTKLFAGGTFLVGATSSNLAAWNGSSWTPVVVPSAVTALAVHDDGGGPALFVGHKNVGQTYGGLLRLRNGISTTLPLSEVSSITRMVTFGNRLWILGTIGALFGSIFCEIQSWDGVQFRNAFSGNGMHGQVSAARVLDIGNGPRLYASGPFTRFGRTPTLCLASFDGTTWSNLGDGPGWYPFALEAWNDGTGMKLFAGGSWTIPGGMVTTWNGSSWSALGSGLSSNFGELVLALQAFDDGSGAKLFVGGVFTTAGGTPVANVARWNGTTWSAAGSGLGVAGANYIRGFAIFDEGAGPRLFACGDFTTSGSTQTYGVARWNGTAWTAVGSGIQGLGSIGSGGVYALCVHDDGSGPKLYAAGNFSLPAGNVARWNGASWSGVGGGLPRIVDALCVHDDGAGPKLYAGISPLNNDGVTSRIRRWDGTNWLEVSGAPAGRASEGVTALVSFDDPSNDPAALYAFGQFSGTENLSSNVAKWSSVTEDVLLCQGDGSGTACPCGNASTSVQGAGCLNSLGLAGTLRSSGVASVSGDSLHLLGTSMANGATLYFQGTASVELGAGAAFGDGLRCAGGTVLRLATIANQAGASQLPDFAHPAALSVVGAIPVGGATRVYQAWYRNAAAFCTSNTFNLTNGVRITWRP